MRWYHPRSVKDFHSRYEMASPGLEIFLWLGFLVVVILTLVGILGGGAMNIINWVDVLNGEWPPKEPSYVLFNLLDIPHTVNATLKILADTPNVVGVSVVINPVKDRILWGAKA